MDITISGDTDSEFLECVDDILRNRGIPQTGLL